jgi:hypothetical protein
MSGKANCRTCFPSTSIRTTLGAPSMLRGMGGKATNPRATVSLLRFTKPRESFLRGGSQLFVLRILRGTVENNTQIHQRPRRARRALPVGVAHRVAVKAKHGMIKRNRRLVSKSSHNFVVQSIGLLHRENHLAPRSCALYDECGTFPPRVLERSDAHHTIVSSKRDLQL